MRTYLSLFAASALLTGASAFAPTTKVASTTKTSLRASFPDEEKSVGKAMENLKSRVNVGSFADGFASMKDNVSSMAGDVDVGGRGEMWTAGIAALVACVVFGGLPIIGGLTSVVLGPGLLLGGVALIGTSVTELGDSLSPWPKAGDHGVVTTGIYGKLRHPLYAGIVAALAGGSVVSDSATRLLLTGILFYVIDIVTDMEEAQLEEKYPFEWGSYMSEVPGKFWPKNLFDDIAGGLKSKIEE